MENFFYNFEYFSDLDDLIDKCFSYDIDLEEQINEMKDDEVFECMKSKLEPIVVFSSEWITERIDDDRFSENNVDLEIDKITKALDDNIDFEKINTLIPKLYFPDRKNKFKITKKDLLEWIQEN